MEFINRVAVSPASSPAKRFRITRSDSEAALQNAATFLTGASGSGGSQLKACNCKNSRCLKLYCDCFAAGGVCGITCNCRDCANSFAHNNERTAAIKAIVDRNPRAFSKSKNADTIAELDDSGAAGLSSNAGSSTHKGCNCRKSGCRKKYCECFQAGIPCSDACRCIDCRNVDINGGAIRTSLALPHVHSASTAPPHATNHVNDYVATAALAVINAFRSRPLPADEASVVKPSSALLSWQQTLAAADCSPAWRDVWNSVWQVLQSTARRPFGHATADALPRRVSAPLTDSKIADFGKALISAAKSASHSSRSVQTAVVSEFTNQLTQNMLSSASNLKSEQSIADEQDAILQTLGRVLRSVDMSQPPDELSSASALAAFLQLHA